MSSTQSRINLLVVLSLSTCGLVSCGDASSETTSADRTSEQTVQVAKASTAQTAKINSQTQTSAGPALSFPTLTYDLGTMSETETRSTRIEFSNSGNGALIVEDIQTTCGCTAARLDKRTYAPGETGFIDVEFDPSGAGEQRKYVNIFTNAPTAQPTRFLILANVQPFLIFEPKMLTLGKVQYRQEHRESISVTSPFEPVKIESVTANSPYLSPVYLEDPENPGKGKLEVTVSDNAPWGGLYGFFEITGRGKPSPNADEMTHTVKIRYGMKLFGELEADPDAFRFGIEPGESFERRIKLVRTGGAPFDVRSVTQTVEAFPGALVRFEKSSPYEYELILSGTGPSRAKNYHGRVSVATNVPGEELIELPIFGVVRHPQRGQAGNSPGS